MSGSLVTLLSLALPWPSLGFIPDPCSLIPRAEVESLLGASVSQDGPAPLERDEASGGTLVYCTYHGGNVVLMVSIVEFGTRTEADRQAAKVESPENGAAGRPAVEVEPGLGERAFWGTSGSGAELVVLKGNRVLSLGLGGGLAQPPASYRAQLHALAEGAVAKL